MPEVINLFIADPNQRKSSRLDPRRLNVPWTLRANAYPASGRSIIFTSTEPSEVSATHDDYLKELECEEPFDSPVEVHKNADDAN